MKFQMQQADENKKQTEDIAQRKNQRVDQAPEDPNRPSASSNRRSKATPRKNRESHED